MATMTLQSWFDDTTMRPPPPATTTATAEIFFAVALGVAVAVAAATLKFAAHVRARRRAAAEKRRVHVVNLEWQLVTRVVESPFDIAGREPSDNGAANMDRRSLVSQQAPKTLDFLDASDHVAATLTASALGRWARLFDHAVDRSLARAVDPHSERVWQVAPLLTGDSVCVVTYTASLCCGGGGGGGVDWVLTAHLRHWSLTLERELARHTLQRGEARVFGWPIRLLFVAPAHVVAIARNSQLRIFRLPTLVEAPDVPLDGNAVVWRNTLMVADRRSARLMVYADGPDRPPVRVERHVTFFVVPTRFGGRQLFVVAALRVDDPMRFYAVAAVAQLVRPDTWLELAEQSDATRLGAWAAHHYRRFSHGHYDSSRNAPPETDGSAMDYWYAAPERVRRRLEWVHVACERCLPMPVCALVDGYLRRGGGGDAEMLPPEVAPAS